MVDDALAVVVIDLVSTEDSRRHRRDLRARRATLLTIAGEPGDDVDVVLPGADLPVALRAVPAALPVQWCAYHLAQACGQEPGDFRHVGWVVR
jgi:fructoselysine-6-P-deglycase FrlB-like protein